MVKFQIRSEGCRAVSVGSPIRFFDPILNNALALRASQNSSENDTAENEPMKNTAALFLAAQRSKKLRPERESSTVLHRDGVEKLPVHVWPE